MKKSILVIADFPNWAYYEIQQFIYRNLQGDFDIYCDYMIYNSKIKSKNPLKRIKFFFDKRKYRKIKKDKNYDIVLYLAFYLKDYINVGWQSKYVIKGIYTDGFPPSNSYFHGSYKEFIEKFFSDTDAIVCGSRNIMDFYQKEFDKIYYCTNIKNELLFKRTTPKIINQSDHFIIGWTGNPKREFKGYYTHIIPAVEILKKKYPDVELKSRFSGPLSTLPLFYEDVDVVIIASDADAGPSLFGEASLMEVPCVSTKIGFPNEVIRNNYNGFLVNKNINEIVSKLEYLYLNREVLYQMSLRIREDYLQKFNKADMKGKWKAMFDNVLEQNKN